MNFVRRWLLSLGIAALVALAAACGGDAKKTDMAKTIDERFPIKLGARTVQMQVALSPGEMERGLMFVKAMGADEGMLFVFERPQTMSFWMRNTELPLDIGYLDADGTLREIYPLYPHDEQPVHSLGRRQLALEMNRGWFARAGVKPGAKLDLAALNAAIAARGIRAQAYGLK